MRLHTDSSKSLNSIIKKKYIHSVFCGLENTCRFNRLKQLGVLVTVVGGNLWPLDHRKTISSFFRLTNTLFSFIIFLTS